jgi:parafibromin
MTTHDALELFRISLSSSISPILLTAASEPASTLPEAAYISFPLSQPHGTVNLAKDASTRYTSKSDSKDEFYNVGQLWLAWSERESGVREYLVKGQQGGLGYVGIADRRGVVEYLMSGGEPGGDETANGRVVPKGDQQGELRHTTSSALRC